KEKTLENRLTKIDFVFLNKLYKPHEKCYLNMELNGNLTREPFTIDLFYSEE
ncbi:putative DNA repair protein, partial [Listeria ivanovii FSL F6-596]